MMKTSLDGQVLSVTKYQSHSSEY